MRCASGCAPTSAARRPFPPAMANTTVSPPRRGASLAVLREVDRNYKQPVAETTDD